MRRPHGHGPAADRSVQAEDAAHALGIDALLHERHLRRAVYSGLRPHRNVEPQKHNERGRGHEAARSDNRAERTMASVLARFLKATRPPIQPLAAIMPTETRSPAIADCVVVPPKWSSTMSGNSADMGENSTENAKPIQSMANRP